MISKKPQNGQHFFCLKNTHKILVRMSHYHDIFTSRLFKLMVQQNTYAQNKLLLYHLKYLKTLNFLELKSRFIVLIYLAQQSQLNV